MKNLLIETHPERIWDLIDLDPSSQIPDENRLWEEWNAPAVASDHFWEDACDDHFPRLFEDLMQYSGTQDFRKDTESIDEENPNSLYLAEDLKLSDE